MCPLDKEAMLSLVYLLMKEWYTQKFLEISSILKVIIYILKKKYSRSQEPLDVEYNLGDVSNKNRDFSNPMYDAVNTETGGTTNGTSASSMYELPAEMKPSSIQHKEPPQLHLKRRELDPTPVDSGKDTQQLVEEDKSEC